MVPPENVAQVGPDYAGRYERVFAALQKELTPYSEDLNALLNLTELSEQQKRIAPSTELGHQLDRVFDSVMNLPNLARLYGKEATRNPVKIFSRHFADRVRHVLATIPAKHNPYLWQMLLGRYPQNNTTPWLHHPLTAALPVLTYTVQFMTDALASVSSKYDFVHLSNILDWLSPEQAQRTLEQTWHALKPGGWTLIRQLNSDVGITDLNTSFQWDTAQAHDLHMGDRSFFYRSLHLGRKSRSSINFNPCHRPSYPKLLRNLKNLFVIHLVRNSFFTLHMARIIPGFSALWETGTVLSRNETAKSWES